MTKDMLEDIFQLQAQLNRRIGVDTESMPEDKQPEWVLNYCRALSQEVAELTDSVPWKWWARYQKYDKQNARVELVDALHFVVSLAQVLGLSAADVHRLYTQKHRINLQRQESGYRTKDEQDCRAVDPGH